MPRTPKPSPTQFAALVDLVERRPGCHLLKVPTARALENHGWVTRRVETLEGSVYPAVYFDVTAAGYAAIGRTAPTPAADEQHDRPATAAAPGPLGELLAEMREHAETLPDAIPPATAVTDEPATPARPRMPAQRGDWHPRPGGLSTASRRASWAMARRLTRVPAQVTDDERTARQAVADRSPCAPQNATAVEVYLSPLTGAAVHLVCGGCGTSHWSSTIRGTYASAAAVPVDDVARLIRRQGVRIAGAWYDHQVGGSWPTVARRAPLERDDRQ